MDFKQWLAEMPLATYKYQFSRPRMGVKDPLFQGQGKDRYTDYDIYGDPQKQKDVNGYFSQRDRTTISHPKTFQTLEKILSRHAHKFNILMFEHGRFDTEGLWTPTTMRSTFEKKVHEYMAMNQIPYEGHITFVKNGSTGHIMSPWMVLHTLGHALFGKLENREWFDACTEIIGSSWKTLLRSLAFKSANATSKENDVATTDELIYELVAEYLWNGKIRFKEPDRKPLPFSSGFVGPSYSEDSEAVIKIKLKNIEALIEKRLSEAVGKVVSDFFA